MEDKIMFKRIDHVEIIPSDLERSIKFYTDVLGFRLKERFKVEVPPLEEVAFLQLGDTMLEFLKVKNPTPASEQWQVGYKTMALEVKNMDEAIVYLASKGIKPTWGPVDLGKSKRAEFKDPDGLSIELRQW
jgi:glyoxylase I family protein